MDANLSPLPIVPATTDEEKIAWLRLIRSQNVGPITFYDLLRRFGKASTALEELPHMARRGGLKRELVPYSESQALKEIERVASFGARLVFRHDPDYPEVLGYLQDAPPVLTIKGQAHQLMRPSVGIVGARNASLNGRKFAEKIAQELGEQGYGVVSGLARGIDTYAHQGSLKQGTIAVVAGGIDIIYPPENTSLYHKIIETGAIVAESPIGVEPQATFFPKRNRLISGLSLGIVVVEATLKSGSLITARYALEQNREVFAVPGSPFDPRCQGTNGLIRQGATLIQSTSHILEGLRPLQNPLVKEGDQAHYTQDMQENQFMSDQRACDEIREKLLTNLSYTPISIDELVRQCHVSPAELLYIVLELELAGKVKRAPGNKIGLVGTE